MSKHTRWTAGEIFLLFKYPELSVEEITNRINKSFDRNRTKNSVRLKIQRINLTKDYKENTSSYSLKDFCNDCTSNPSTCGKKPEKCIEKADTYLKFYEVENINEDENIQDNIEIEKHKCKEPKQAKTLF